MRISLRKLLRFVGKQGKLRDVERLGDGMRRSSALVNEKHHLFKLWKGPQKCKKGREHKKRGNKGVL